METETIVPTTEKKESFSWKKLFVRSAGFGAGVALMLVTILVAYLWYESRPKPPKPWNNQAITAEYDYAGTHGDKNHIEVCYTIQNNTDFDYHLDNKRAVRIAAVLDREKSILTDSEDEMFGGTFPFFVPAKGRARFCINIAYSYKEPKNSDASKDEKHDYGTRLAKFIVDKMSNLDGFVLFDNSSRFQINLPSGWKARASEPLRNQPSEPSEKK